MDKLDPAREIVVAAIGTLENAIENLIPAQSPRSTNADIAAGVLELRSIAMQIAEHADRVESALDNANRDDR